MHGDKLGFALELRSLLSRPHLSNLWLFIYAQERGSTGENLSRQNTHTLFFHTSALVVSICSRDPYVFSSSTTTEFILAI